VGQLSVELSNGLLRYLRFVGQLTVSVFRNVKGGARWQPAALAIQVLHTGLQALPIIGLLSCLVGVVLAYQLGVQLQSYGANIFIPDLLGLSVLREFGPLLTAIMVAGRTGSAFTAELGMMKINQEIDALRTMGYLPDTLLILPRVVGLVITLPLLVMWADVFGVLGGMLMSHAMLGLSWHDFLDRLQHQVPLRALVIGLCKAPVFALLIAGIGCFQGMAVTGTAESLGRNTTRSVVLAIFFIILADAAFSIVFSWWNL
jgi:phospholipid/cholesterol/gamma-HCH transport system permease protein